MGKMGLRDQNKGKKIEINGSRIYHVTTLRLALLVFHAKFLFPKDNRLFVKKELESLFPFRSTLYCPLDDQKPLEKQAF